ncbi:MAG: LamG-like jellyroll fold domain-containing protein [Promethearchaeota archaeon]
MITKIHNKKKNLKIAILSIILTASFFLSVVPMFNSNSEDPSVVENEDLSEKTPLLSTIGYDVWWNASFPYRRLINITNPFGVDLINRTVSVEFNYSTLVNEGKMNSSLKDIRIVENGRLRNYFYMQDFPQTDLATVWFQANITYDAVNPDMDTYMYYGNNTVGLDETYFMSNIESNEIWYQFEEGQGSDVSDSIGNYNGLLYGGIWQSEGAIGGALELNGVSDYIAIYDKYYQNAGEITELTISCWFKTSFGGAGQWDNWAFFDYDRSEYFNFYIRGDNGRVGFSSTHGTSIDDFSSNEQNLNNGEWHFACATYDGTNKRIYIDGGSPTVDTANPTDIGSGNYVRYGFVGDGSEATNFDGNRNNFYYEGLIDEVRFFKNALSANEIDFIYKNYSAPAYLNEEQIKAAKVTITTYDIDGGIVENANVSLYNATGGFVVNGFTSSDGSVTFIDLEQGGYNITVQYTMNGNTTLVYNSSDTEPDRFDFQELVYDEDIITDLWTIDFEIDDWNGDPLNYGYINVSISEGGPVLDTINLDADGLASFVWENRGSYYYEVYYNNSDYTPIQTPLNASYIYRSDYDIEGQKYHNYGPLDANTEKVSLPANKYYIDFDLYTDGNSSFNYNKLNRINVTIKNMDDFLEKVQIFYIDKDGQTSTLDHLLYENETYAGGTYDNVEFNIRNPPEIPVKLRNDNFEVYGIHLYVEFYDSDGSTNGVIEINTTEACHIFNKTDLTKIKIKVLDNTLNAPVSGVIVHVTNQTNSIVNLTTKADGFAYGIINSDVEFWYTRGYNYTFSLEYFGQLKPFYINKTDPPQWKPSSQVSSYNYTPLGNSSLIFKMVIDPSQYSTNFTSVSGSSSATWGQNLNFQVTFEYTDPVGSGPIDNPDTLTAVVKSQDTYETMLTRELGDFSPLGSGQFLLSINSSLFSAGNSSKNYFITITGSKSGYSNPSPVYLGFTVNAVPTSISIHDYDNRNLVLTEVSQYYEESIKIPVKYYITSSGSAIAGATLSYEWQFGSGPIPTDPSDSDYYIFEIDTSVATNIGKYRIDITAYYENYSMQVDYPVDINIIARPTLINGISELLQLSPKLWVNESANYTFEYRDVLRDERVSGLETASYTWFRLDENGNPLTGEGNEGFGDLIETNDSLYTLDFDTETREVGEYSIFVSLQKNSYEIRHSYLTLTIQKRLINASLDITGLTENRIDIVQGDTIKFRITLTDPTNQDQLLTRATVTFTFQGKNYTLTPDENDPGVYILSLPTSNIDAFILPNTLRGILTFEKENYETKTVELIIVVGLTEIFPGMPMFYFILIVGGIVAVVGSLATYRFVQQARIPTFVKKARKMKKEIKGKKTISESLLYPSKEEYLVKKLGDKWDTLGLSLRDVLGVEVEKKKTIPEIKEEIKFKEPMGGED